MFGRQLLTLLFKPEYAAYNGVLIWMMCAAVVNLTGYTIGHGLVVARYLRSQLLIAVATTGSTTIASLALIPTHGLYGAAWAMSLGAVVQLAGSIYAGRDIGVLGRRITPAEFAGLE